MPESRSRQGLLFCAAAATVIIVALLAYEGALDEIARGLWDLILDIMRAINRE